MLSDGSHPREDEAMGFRETLRDSDVKLTDSERRIGAILLGDRHGAPLFTASQLAQQAEVHESTVVRFAQKLGYSGYIALRLDLASDSLGRPRSKPQPTGEQASLAHVIRAQIEVLERLEDNVPQAAIDEAMTALISAKHVFVVGDGLVGPLAEFFARKVSILGIPTTVVRQTGTEMELQLATARGGDILVVFVLTSEYESVATLHEVLAARGVTIILVTDQPVLTYQPKADYVLAVPRSELNHGVFVVLAAVAYAMDYSLMLQLRDRSEAASTE